MKKLVILLLINLSPIISWSQSPSLSDYSIRMINPNSETVIQIDNQEIDTAIGDGISLLLLRAILPKNVNSDFETVTFRAIRVSTLTDTGETIITSVNVNVIE